MSASKTKKREDYIVKNYDGGFFNSPKARRTWSSYRKLGRKISQYDWARDVGFKGNRLDNEDEISRLENLFEEAANRTTTNQTARREKREKNRKGRVKDDRSLRDERGRFGKWVPRPSTSKKDPQTGRFISNTEYEKLLQLTILNNKRNTPEREKERENLTDNLQQTQRTVQIDRLEERQHRRLQTARNEVVRIQGVLEEQEIQLQELENTTSSSSSILNDIGEKKAVVEELRERLKAANEEVIRLQNELLRGPTDLEEEIADGDSGGGGGFDGNFDDDDDDLGNEGGTYNAGTTTTTTTQQARTTLETIADLPLYQGWSPQVELDGVLRRPIRLRTVLKWIQNLTEIRLCDGIKRLRSNAKRRPVSWYTEFKRFSNAQMFNTVQTSPDTFSIPTQDIMWAWKPATFNSNARISNGIGQLPANTNTLVPVLLSSLNDQLIGFNTPPYIKTWIGQASALTRDTVIMVTSSVERQMVDTRTNIEWGGWANGDYWENEKYKIPIRKLFEIMFYMLAYRKEKARIVSIYDPQPIITAVLELINNDFRNGIQPGTVVYKPWFDYEKDTAKTLVTTPKRALTQAWYIWCWNADFGGDGFGRNGEGDLDLYHARPTPAQKRRGNYSIDQPTKVKNWDAPRLGGANQTPRRIAYDNGIIELDRIYNDFIRNWGGVGIGQQVLNQIAEDLPRANVDDAGQENEGQAPTLNNPLIEFERIDEVFTRDNLADVVNIFIDRMNEDQWNIPDVALQRDTIVSRMLTIFSTEKQRGVKRGIVASVASGQITVQWDLPYGVFDGTPVNPRQTYIIDDILKNHRKVAGFLLSKVGRTIDKFMYGESTTLVDHLRGGNLLDLSYRNNLQANLNRNVRKDFVTFEIDLSLVVGMNNQRPLELIEANLSRFVAKIELIGTGRPCDGKWRDPNWRGGTRRNPTWTGSVDIQAENRPDEIFTIAKEVKNILNDIEDFFRKENVDAQQCVNRDCRVVERGTDF